LRWESKKVFPLRRGGSGGWGVRNCVVVMDIVFVLGVGKVSVQERGDEEDLDFGR
jgi:hypothetical protein